MGGKEASRGFLYQGFASVLEALTDKNKWDKIYIEFPTSNDKVDIALGAANKVIKSIQVKSTINTFSKSDIMVWLRDLIADIDAPEYELCLIGQCEKSAITFKNSIEKFYNNTLDNTAVKSLDKCPLVCKQPRNHHEPQIVQNDFVDWRTSPQRSIGNAPQLKILRFVDFGYIA